jgi:hypothetical protein
MIMLIKILAHPWEWYFCTLLSAAVPWLLPLFFPPPPDSPVAATVAQPAQVIVWNWPAVQLYLVLIALGMIGGAVSLVGNPIPVKSIREGVARVLLGGAVSSILAGMVLYYAFGTDNPAVITAVGGFLGFVSYPLVLYGHKYALLMFLRKINVPVEETKGDEK